MDSPSGVATVGLNPKPTTTSVPWQERAVLLWSLVELARVSQCQPGPARLLQRGEGVPRRHPLALPFLPALPAQPLGLLKPFWAILATLDHSGQFWASQGPSGKIKNKTQRGHGAAEPRDRGTAARPRKNKKQDKVTKLQRQILRHRRGYNRQLVARPPPEGAVV